MAALQRLHPSLWETTADLQQRTQLTAVKSNKSSSSLLLASMTSPLSLAPAVASILDLQVIVTYKVE